MGQTGQVPPLTYFSPDYRGSVALPWVATLCGFVVHGADLTGFDHRQDGHDAFRLEPPGPWFVHLQRRWFPTGRGGRPWVVWDPRLPPVLTSARG